MIYVLFILVLISLDLSTKLWVHQSLYMNQSIPIIPGWLRITRVENTGAAFSMLEGQMVFFKVFTIIAIAGLVYAAYRFRRDKILFFSLLVAIAGAIGNLYDRVVFGYVRDFIDVPFFAIFNVADIFIVLGMIVMAIRILFFEELIKQGMKEGADTKDD